MGTFLGISFGSLSDLIVLEIGTFKVSLVYGVTVKGKNRVKQKGVENPGKKWNGLCAPRNEV